MQVMRCWIAVVISFTMIFSTISSVQKDGLSHVSGKFYTDIIRSSSSTSDPISVNDDLSLSLLAAEEGWGGNGSKSSPYVISDLTIDGRSGGYGLFVGNVTNHLRIDNLFIYNSTYRSFPYQPGSGIMIYRSGNVTVLNSTIVKCSSGISLVNSRNISIRSGTCRNCTDGIRIMGSVSISVIGCELKDNSGHGAYVENSAGCRLRDNSASNNDLGIYLKGCRNNRIENNTCERNDDHGIRLDGSNANVIADNICPLNDDGIHLNIGSSGNEVNANIIEYSVEYGIYIENSHGNAFFGNEMVNCSFMILGDKLTYVSHIIPSNNTVNTHPVRYLVNLDMTGDPGPAGSGQIIMGNITGADVSNANIGNVSCGITIGYSTGITIRNSRIRNIIYYGINIDSSTNIEITGCTLENNLFAVYMVNSIDCRILGSNVTESGTAARIEGSQGIAIGFNSIHQNSQGIVLDEGTVDSIVAGNFIFLHEWSGISILGGCRNISVTDNELHYLEPGVEIIGSNDNLINGNDFNYTNIGMDVQYSTGNILIGNFLMNCGEKCIVLGGSGNSVISNELGTDMGTCIDLEGSNNLIVNNIAGSKNGKGFVVLGDRNIIRNNDISTPFNDGIWLYYTKGNVLDSNILDKCSIGITGDLIHYMENRIAPNNTVNGDPVCLLVNENTFPYEQLREAGEIIAVNINGLMISDLDSDESTSFMIFKSCSGIRINSSKIGSRTGIRMEDSSNMILEDCSFNRGAIDILLRGTRDVTIRNCFFESSHRSISIGYSDRTYISWNDFTSVDAGIGISNSGSIQITNNTLECIETGISIMGESGYINASDNIILSESGSGLVIPEGVILCNFTHNTFCDGTTASNEGAANRFFENCWDIAEPVDENGDGVNDIALVIPGNRASDPRPLLHMPRTTLPPPFLYISNKSWPESILSWEPPAVTRHRDEFNLKLFEIRDDGSEMWISTVPGETGMIGFDTRDEGVRHSFSAEYEIDYGKSGRSNQLTVRTDWNPPTIVKIFPSDGIHINRDHVTVKWDHNDSVSSVDQVLINHRFYEEFPEIPLPEPDLWLDIDKEKSHEFRGLKDGYHFVTVRAHDISGHFADETFHFIVDTTPPGLEITSPSNGSRHPRNYLNVNIFLNDRLSINYSESLYLDGSLIIHEKFQFQHEFYGRIYNMTDGLHTIRIEITDTAGNTA
ncbi:MAG: NosD domain-containing protein, partial [Thermoplasmatota archaeon]